MQDLWRGFRQSPLLDAAPHACSPLQTPVLHPSSTCSPQSVSEVGAECCLPVTGCRAIEGLSDLGRFYQLGCEHCEHEAACVRCPLSLLLRCSWWPSSLNSEKGNLKALFLISPSSVVFLSSLKLEEKNPLITPSFSCPFQMSSMGRQKTAQR